jgi:K+-sensing histidine kinase KdpD
MFPKKDSEKWFIVFSLSWLLNLAAIIASRYQISYIFDMPTTFVFLIMSLLVASITMVGWFGLLDFTKVFILFNFFGICSMLYITSTGYTSGWADITSLINYLFFIAIGVIAGLLVQLTGQFLKKEVKKPAAKKKTAKKKK